MVPISGRNRAATRPSLEARISPTYFLKNFVDIPNSSTQYLVPDISLIQHMEYLWGERGRTHNLQGRRFKGDNTMATKKKAVKKAAKKKKH
jgi:hypothetical protein